MTRLSDFIDTAIYIDILFVCLYRFFSRKYRFIFFIDFFSANFIEKSDITISENTEH